MNRAHLLLSHPAHFIALGFGAGLSPVAPGTVGTLWAWATYGVLQSWLSPAEIGVVIAITALTGYAIAPGRAPVWQVAVLTLAVLVSSAAAGAFNQYYEFELDRRMDRTRARPFATGVLRPHRGWLALIAGLCAAAVLAAWAGVNAWAALYTFLGAFFYAVVYTVWLKRRTWWNIVIGGLAGSFAVLAGAAAVDAAMAPAPLLLALVLFLWTPSHFWSLAIAYREDYARAGVPMLPVVKGDRIAARAILANTILLVAASLAPFWFGCGWIYLAGALLGGLHYLKHNLRLLARPDRKSTRLNSSH